MLTSIRSFTAATLLVGALLAGTPALAEEETAPPSDITITGNVAIVSDYRFRGLSFTAGDPAIQGGINVNHKSGFYAGTWASNLEQDAADVFGNMELDLFVGWTGSVASGLTADVGLLYYAYPNGKTGKAEYFEPYASLSTTLGPASAKVGLAYAWSQDALGGGDNLYIYTDWGVGIPSTPISLAAHLGYASGVQSPKFLTGAGTGGGVDYSLGATVNVTKNLSLGASYIGVAGNSIKGFSDDTVVATLKLSF